MVQDTRFSIRPGHILFALLAVACSIALWFYGILAVGVVLAIGGCLILIAGFLILPRNAGRREWKRTMGVWAISMACFLFSATTFFLQQPTGDSMLAMVFWFAGLFGLMVGVVLLWDKT